MDLAQISVLKDAGFRLDLALKEALDDDANQKGLGTSGPYVVDAALRKGLVTLKFERNTSTEISGGQTVTVQYAPVCIVDGPGGRVTCSASDTDLIIRMAGELA